MWGATVEDYLSEKEQWEWLKTQVRENAPAVVLALLVVAAGVFGWRWWQGRLDAGRLEAGAAGDSLLALKIADLTADTAAPAPAQAASTTAKSTASGAGR